MSFFLVKGDITELIADDKVVAEKALLQILHFRKAGTFDSLPFPVLNTSRLLLLHQFMEEVTILGMQEHRFKLSVMLPKYRTDRVPAITAEVDCCI